MDEIPSSALVAAWRNLNPIVRGATDFADFEAGWNACAAHFYAAGIPIEARPDTPETRAEDEASDRELAEELAAPDPREADEHTDRN